VPSDGVWTFQVVRRVTGGLDPLLAAYAVPDAGPAAPGTACSAVAWASLAVFLHNASGVRAVRAPQDDCGGPTSAARTAYESVTTTVVWEKKTRQIQSQQSVDSSCPDQFKDMLAIDEQFQSSGRSPAAPRPVAAPALECTYRVVVDAQGDRVGHLQSHRTLTADQLAAVNGALSHLRADPTCSRHEQTRFAVLGMTREPTTYVAVDGCAVAQDSGWWRAGDNLRATLAG
jgi:hypothetical protein